jgi:hypothetical protein
MTTTLSIRCRCGTLQGTLDPKAAMSRAVCYCRDCQAFARFVERGAGQGSAAAKAAPGPAVMDAHGGTPVVASLPRGLRFTAGTERLACMSLSPKGLLRWYAACCHTPIGNTARDPKMAYVGVIEACIADGAAALDTTLGRSQIRVNTGSALEPVPGTPLGTALAVATIMRRVLGARLGGSWRQTPFFAPGTDRPVAAPRVLAIDERRALAEPGQRADAGH